jgi:predicted acyltransferase
MSATEATPAPERLRSLDAYRGFVMLAMASAGLGLVQVAEAHPNSRFWELLAGQFEHVSWRGCAFWDLIQPSFMFMVGVAMPFSEASRIARGEPWGRRFRHVLWRSLVLVALGIFLSSASSRQVNFTFVNVLTQIGLGYWFVWLVLRRPPWVQAAVAGLILVAYWGLFALYPVPPRGTPSGLPANWTFMQGFAAHWEKNLNAAADFDRWFLNLFPREKPFTFNEGGYQTLNFVPSIATMLFGVLAGKWLRSAYEARVKVLGLMLAGAVCLALGTTLDPVTVVDRESWARLDVLCPIVKRIWTPSWTVYSTAWTCWMLAGFYGVIDVLGWKKWAFPFTVVGMNSIAMYVMAQLLPGWIRRQIQIHVGTLFGWLHDRVGLPLSREVFAGSYAPLLWSLAVLLVLWLATYWMYRRKLFLRI